MSECDNPDQVLQVASSPEHERAVEDIWDSDHNEAVNVLHVRRLTRGMRMRLALQQTWQRERRLLQRLKLLAEG